MTQLLTPHNTLHDKINDKLTDILHEKYLTQYSEMQGALLNTRHSTSCGTIVM